MIWMHDARSIKGLDVSLQRSVVIINVLYFNIIINIILIKIIIIVIIMIICLVENGGDYRR